MYTFIKITYFTAYITNLSIICLIGVMRSSSWLSFITIKEFKVPGNFDLVNTYFGIDFGHTYDRIDVTAEMSDTLSAQQD